MNSRLSALSRDQLTLLVRKLQAKLKTHDATQRHPIAIVGMACRMPEAGESVDGYWQLLRDGHSGITKHSADRWNLELASVGDPDSEHLASAQWAGLLSNIQEFDASFFDISTREAAAMDPQHRLLLEVAWEALESSGQAPTALHGSRTGVFVGITNNDYVQQQLLSEAGSLGIYYATGNAFSVAAGRLSYLLGLQGPAMAIDTACSSSLVAVHLACQSLRSGESDLALAGGVNAILSPETSIVFAKARMLAPDGRCKTFDAAADGYVRSEGCGVVVLKRLADARRDDDPILAVIRGSAVNQDGQTQGLTALP